MDYPEVPQAGRAIVTIAGILFPALLLLNAARRIPDVEYERACVVGMLFAAGGWLLYSLAGLFHRLSEVRAVLIAGLVLVVPLIGAGAAFASFGLRSQEAPKGRGLGSGALLVSGLIAIALVLGLFQGFGGELPAVELPAAWKRRPRVAGSRIEVIGKGYSFAVPPPSWVELDPAQIHPEADLVFLHEGKGVFFFLVASPRAPEDVDTHADLARDRQEELRKLDAGAVVGDVVMAAAGEVPGLAFHSTLRGKNDVLAFRHWVSATPRFAFLLVTWGPATSRGDVDALSQELLAGFALRN